MKLTCVLVLVLSLVVQPISDAKKLVQAEEKETVEEKEDTSKEGDSASDEKSDEKPPEAEVMKESDQEPPAEVSCSQRRCGDGWAPKSDHHKLKGSTDEECCRPTCALYKCPDGYKSHEKYYTNIVEANDSTHACCDRLCSAYDCNAGFLVREGRRSMLAESHDFCCDVTCVSFPCTGRWNSKADPHLRTGSNMAECCEASCAMWNCTGAWEAKPEVLAKTGTSNEECCWQNCDKIPTCPVGHVKRTEANKTDGACCRPMCSLHSCSDGFTKPMIFNEEADTSKAANDDMIGESDEACCVETCKRHTCEGDWAENPRREYQAMVLDNGSANPFCCNPRCSLHVCNVTAGWSKDESKAELDKQDDPSCCQNNCRLVPCPAGKALNILAENLTGKTMNEHSCCEIEPCAKLRKGKHPVSEGCKSIESGEKCLQSYEMKESGTGSQLTACGFLTVNGQTLGCVASETNAVDGCGF